MNSYLKINKPCHESWDKMDHSEKGGFCASCKKHVIDFTETSLDVARQLLQTSENGVCGRFSAIALKEQYVESRMRTFHGSFIRKFSFAVLFCFGSSLFTIDAAQASTLSKIKSSFFRNSLAVIDTVYITGKVKDKETKEELPFVRITAYFDGKLIATAETDLDGKYRLRIAGDYSKINITSSYIGYDAVTIENVELDKRKNKELNIDLNAGPRILMGDYIEEKIVPEKYKIEDNGKVIIKPQD